MPRAKVRHSVARVVDSQEFEWLLISAQQSLAASAGDR